MKRDGVKETVSPVAVCLLWLKGYKKGERCEDCYLALPPWRGSTALFLGGMGALHCVSMAWQHHTFLIFVFAFPTLGVLRVSGSGPPPPSVQALPTPSHCPPPPHRGTLGGLTLHGR